MVLTVTAAVYSLLVCNRNFTCQINTVLTAALVIAYKSPKSDSIYPGHTLLFRQSKGEGKLEMLVGSVSYATTILSNLDIKTHTLKKHLIPLHRVICSLHLGHSLLVL